MAQVRFGQGVCERQFAPRPDLQPRFFGLFTPSDDPPCLSSVKLGDEKRRPDVPAAQYGRGTPAQVSNQRDPFGVPMAYVGEYDEVVTEQGVVRLTRDDTEGWNRFFMPTTSLLSVAPLMDSRMLPLSDRYFK